MHPYMYCRQTAPFTYEVNTTTLCSCYVPTVSLRTIFIHNPDPSVEMGFNHLMLIFFSTSSLCDKLGPR